MKLRKTCLERSFDTVSFRDENENNLKKDKTLVDPVFKKPGINLFYLIMTIVYCSSDTDRCLIIPVVMCFSRSRSLRLVCDSFYCYFLSNPCPQYNLNLVRLYIQTRSVTQFFRHKSPLNSISKLVEIKR